MLTSRAATPLTVLALLALVGCGGPEEVLDDAARAAGCAAAEQAVSPVKDRAQAAVDDLGVDPDGARRELEVLQGAVDAATATVSGDLEQSLRRISDELGVLTDEARDAARGTVDQRAVDRAQDELSSAVDEVTTIC